MIPDVNLDVTKFPSLRTIKKFNKAAKIVIRKLRIEQIERATVEDIKYQKFSPETYAGFHYENYLNCKKKKEAFKDAYEVAVERFNYIESCDSKNNRVCRSKIFPSTYTIGARNKRESAYDEGEILTSRAVHMPEFHVELNSACWIDPITNLIKDRGRGPIYIGNSISKHERLVKDSKDCVFATEGDVKRFDSKLWLIQKICSLSICRCFYELDSTKIDNHFLGIFDSISIMDYITPGGFIYRFIHGLPSGVKATSLLGSMCNFLFQVEFHIDFDNRLINYVIGGDDFVNLFKVFIENIIEIVNKKCADVGWEFKFLKIKDFKAKLIKDRPCFYKYTLDDNEPIIPTSALFERFMLPWNKIYKSDLELLVFLNDLIPSLGSPRSHHIMFYRYYKNIYFRAFNNDISIEDVYRRHIYFYDKVVNKSLRIKDDTRKIMVNGLQVSINPESSKIRRPLLNKIFFGKERKVKRLMVNVYKKIVNNDL